MTKARVGNQADLAVRLRAGVERLLERGQTYAEISVDDLVNEGGLAKSTFYVYFKDKDELLRVIAAGVMQDLIDFDAAFWGLDPNTATKAETHEALIAMFEAYQEHGALMAEIVAAVLYDPIMREQFAGLMDRTIESTAGYLRAGQHGGPVPEGLDAERVAFWLLWGLESGFSVMQGSEPDQYERRLQALTELIWRAQRGGAG